MIYNYYILGNKIKHFWTRISYYTGYIPLTIFSFLITSDMQVFRINTFLLLLEKKKPITANHWNHTVGSVKCKMLFSLFEPKAGWIFRYYRAITSTRKYIILITKIFSLQIINRFSKILHGFTFVILVRIKIYNSTFNRYFFFWREGVKPLNPLSIYAF